MFSWVEIALTLLKLANSITTWARERELVSVGQDREIARESAAILSKSQFAKETMEYVAGMNQKQTDDVLKQLEG